METNISTRTQIPMLAELTTALDERIAIGNVSHLVNERIQSPLSYIGYVASEVATQVADNDGGVQ